MNLSLLKHLLPRRYVRLHVASSLDGMLSADADRIRIVQRALRHRACGAESLPEGLFQAFGLFLRLQRRTTQAAASIKAGSFSDGYAVVLLMIQRNLRWCLGDLVKGKVTSCYTALRQQAESVGLVALFLKDPALFERWLNLKTSQDGGRFFRETQKNLKRVLEELSLWEVYDRGSYEGVHVRSIQMFRSYFMLDPSESSRTMLVTDSDLDLDSLDRFCRDAAHVMSAEVLLFKALGKIFPEAGALGWTDEVHRLAKRVQGLRDAVFETSREEAK
jgi:hypothetical protein